MDDRNYITIVSGLPRSGTSMMMQMLKAGGMEVLSDHARKADEDNPKGYFELEKVKTLRDDSSWLGNARGKAFKMVSMLLFDLPEGYRYKIVFMSRDLKEVLASQAVMLERLGKGAPKEEDEKMLKLYERHLQEIRKLITERADMDFIQMPYREIIRGNLLIIKDLNDFLGGSMNINDLLSVIDEKLYRNRAV